MVDAQFSKVTSDIGGTGVVGICMISKRCAGLLTKDAPGILRVAAHANVSSAEDEGLDSRNSRGHFPSEKREALEKRSFAIFQSFFKTNNDFSRIIMAKTNSDSPLDVSVA